MAPIVAFSRASPRAALAPALLYALAPAPAPLARQNAKKFNKPLSFDTSSVTIMHGVFKVRSARALALCL